MTARAYPLDVQSAGHPEGRPTLAAVPRGVGHSPRVNTKDMSATVAAQPRLSMSLTGDDLVQLRALDRQYEAMWREFQTVHGEHDADAFFRAEFAFRQAVRDVAEFVNQLFKREGNPVLFQDCEACGIPVRLGQRWCLDCGTFYHSMPDAIDGAEVSL